MSEVTVAPAGLEWRAGAVLARIAREPLTHFLAIGLAMLLLAQWRADNGQDRYRIVVDAAVERRLAATYQQQYGAAPSTEQLRFLVDSYVRQEILYREGLALGLDRDDEIVHRRIAQKYEFLQQDASIVGDPSDAEIESFYRNHRDLYAVPQTVSFSHVFFSPDAGDAAAEARARDVLIRLQSGATTRAPDRGDHFADRYDFSSVDPTAVRRLFGDSPFTNEVFHAPLHRWSGPYRSGFGWHLVYLDDRSDARLLPLEDVRERVRGDAVAAARQRRSADAFDAVARKYTITRSAAGHDAT
jgi:hypothetical protein